MAKIYYFIKGNQNPTSIYVRLRDGKQGIDISTTTGKTINPDYWSNKTGGVKQRAEFSDKLNHERDLRKLGNQILESRNNAISTGTILNRDWLQNEINKYFNFSKVTDPDGLVQRMTEYRESLPTKLIRKTKKIGASQYTIANFGTTIEHLKKFEASKKHTFKLSELDHKFHSDFIRYAQTSLRLAENTIGKDIRQIKTVCIDARDLGYKVHDFAITKKFTAPHSETVFTTLNESELKTIMQFKGSDYLNNARDWLIIGCWTGCRVGDLMNLSMDNVTLTPTGAKLIQYTQSKTGKTIKIPMHPDVETILNNLGSFPRKISDQKFNLYIKKVCKLAGLKQLIEGERQNPKTHLKESGLFEKWELIRSHTCRRSFATNHYSKLPNKVIMAVTGHGSETMLLEYIGEVDNSHVDEFFDLWAKNKETEPVQLQSKKTA